MGLHLTHTGHPQLLASPQLSSPRPYAVQPHSYPAGVAHAVQPHNYPAGAASAACSTVSGEGVLRAQLRQPARFTIHAFDEHGNRCTTGGAPFVLAVRGPSSASRTIVDAGDGTFHAAWVPTVTGAYTVAVSLHGELVGGAPFVVHADTPHADISRSAVEGEGLHHAVAGASNPHPHPKPKPNPTPKPSPDPNPNPNPHPHSNQVAGELASFRVRFADEHGAPAAAEQLTLVLAPQGGLGGQSPGLIYCGVAGGVDGGQTASFSVRRAGDYALTVQLRGSGAVLAGSPFALRVLAAAPYAPACELACEERRTEPMRREGEGEALHTSEAMRTSEATLLAEATLHAAPLHAPLRAPLHASGALACVAGERLRLRLRVRDRWGNACEAEAVGLLTSQVEAGGGRHEVGGVERGGVRLAWTAVRRGRAMAARRLSAVCQPTCKGNMLEHIYFVIAFRVYDMHCIARMR